MMGRIVDFDQRLKRLRTIKKCHQLQDAPYDVSPSIAHDSVTAAVQSLAGYTWLWPVSGTREPLGVCAVGVARAATMCMQCRTAAFFPETHL